MQIMFKNKVRAAYRIHNQMKQKKESSKDNDGKKGTEIELKSHKKSIKCEKSINSSLKSYFFFLFSL